MPPQITHKQFRFAAIGIDANSPPDALRPGRYPVLLNLRPEIDDTLTPRPGLGNGITITGSPSVHSIKRLNDSSSGALASIEIVGAGSTLNMVDTGLGSAAQIANGFSNYPFAMVIAQPPESVKPYLYVEDSVKSCKVDVAGNVKPIGLLPPVSAPSAVLDAPQFKVISDFEAVGSWAADGTYATGLALATRVDPASTSISWILYDSGSSGWASIRPSNTKNMNEGMRITIDPAGSPETTVIKRLFRDSQATTMASIIYEIAGYTSGYAWVHLVTPVEEIDFDSMVLINDGGTAEYARVQDIQLTPDGHQSIRLVLQHLHVAGAPVVAVPSFRCYLTATHSNGQTLSAKYLGFGMVAGTGTITDTSGAATLDLSAIATGLPTQPDDYMHIDLLASAPENISEIRVYLDIDSATHDFLHNYYLHTFRANDFTPVTTGAQTLISNQQVVQQRQLISGNAGSRTLMPVDGGATGPPGLAGIPSVTQPITVADAASPPPGPRSRSVTPTPPGQLNSGTSQWSSCKFSIAELLQQDLGRVGSDTSRGLANVAGIRIEVIATGVTTIGVDGWRIGGGYGPDTGSDRGLIYRYRPLDSSTGVRGNYSPASRGQVFPSRERVILTAAPQASPCDKFEWQRYGGPTLGWHILGTSSNVYPYQLLDTYPDIDIVGADSLVEGNVHYPLWPVVGPPISGVTSASGTLLDLGGVALAKGDLLAPGTAIHVGGQEFTIYTTRDLNTTTHVAGKIELTTSAGYLPANTPWRIPAPLYLNAAPPSSAAATGGTPLPVLAGPFNGFMLGAGDPYNPHYLYYSNGNDPDTTTDINYLPIGNASEPIQNILIFEGRCLVWTTERTYALEPAFTLLTQGSAIFIAREIPNSIGLWSRWAFCAAGDSAAFLSRDGIYETSGGGTRCMTEDLRLIFPHEGSLGITSGGGIAAPAMLSGYEAFFRLSYIDHELMFDYLTVQTTYATLVRRTTPARTIANAYQLEVGWRLYSYTPGIRLHYAEEGNSGGGGGAHSTLAGSGTGKLFRLGRMSADDLGASIIWNVVTPSYSADDDDQRSRKYFMDAMLDYAGTYGDQFSLQAGFDNNQTYSPPVMITIPVSGSRNQYVLDLNSGQGQRARNISLAISGLAVTTRTTLYLWQFTSSQRPESSYLRGLDYEMLREAGTTYLRGIWIYADTAGVSRSALLEYTSDDGTVASVAITGINHSTLTERYYPIPNGIYCVAARVRPTDAGTTWEYVGFRPDGEPAPPLSTEPSAWMNPAGDNAIGARYVQGAIFDIDTFGNAVNLAVQVDNAATQTTIQTGANSGPLFSIARAQIAISFDAPFITHLIRVIPSAPCRLWAAKWVSEPEPELAWMWWTQQTDHGWTVHRMMERGLKGYQVLWGGYLTVRSSGEIIYEIVVDGVSYFATFTDSTTIAQRKKLRFILPAIKGKVFQHKIYGALPTTRIALYKSDCELLVKSWGSEETLQGVDPFGAMHYQNGAEI